MKHRTMVRMFGLAVIFVAGLGMQAAWAQTFKVDPVHSAFHFRIKHMSSSYSYGRFNDASGTFVLDEVDPAKNSIEVEIKTDSVDTNNEMRDKHLKTADFFDVEKYPTMTFKSTAFKKLEDGTYEVTGDFTLHGVTKPVTAKAEFVGKAQGPKGETRAGWDAELVIDRTEFGMDKGVPDMLGAEVTIRIGIEGVQS